MKNALFIFGTRPEAIKMAPLIKTFQENGDLFRTKVCVTAQHRGMLDQVMDFFKIEPDYDINLMKSNQTLFDITANGLKGLEDVMKDFKPDLILVQGDTTTAFIGALAGFYLKAKIAHIEAGLRSGNKYSPFPEEINRVLVGGLADFHFVPTHKAKENLAREGKNENVWIVGNTVIDALLLSLELIKKTGEEAFYKYFEFIDFSKRVILVTGHRRESFGKPFEDICHALKELVENFADIEIVYPVHLNPNVREPVGRILKNIERIHLIDPLDYPRLIWIMNRSYLVLTDSGGIQEEGPTLGKPVLVMREVTERTEGITAGAARLVGADREKILREASLLLTDEKEYNKMAKAVNPYGDGTTSRQIMDILSGLKL